jgi:glycine/D-amino acid oxidase-like deaminating enzyme
MSRFDDADVIVIGGGIVGASVAYGLARKGHSALLLDEGDDAFRAARGNFGLVWVQGKGPGAPHYARWTMRSAAAWPTLARDLADETGIDVQLAQPGGLHVCLLESELAERQTILSGLRASLDIEYPFELLDRDATARLCPHIGPEVVGASFGPLDGHVNPLRLLRALLQAFAQRGGRLATGHRVKSITHDAGVFDVVTEAGRFSAPRIVLTAGLGNRELAPMVGLDAPVAPNRGEILISERLQPFLDHPTAHVRQTGDGGVQLGDSKEDVGYDDRTARAELARIADRAVRMFPLLSRVNVVRAWGALRVMTADGLPIYETSGTHPGAYVVTCHSGITLAAAHADELSNWILGGTQPQEIAPFVAARLKHVQATGHH